MNRDYNFRYIGFVIPVLLVNRYGPILKNSGQMSDKNLLTYGEFDDERNYHYLSLCGNLVSPAGLYSA
ncbi:MAG: hypothetical protein PVI82_16240 [Desulfobacterales bacterium]